MVIRLLMTLFLISGCTSWKQRDFEKDISKDAGTTPQVDADKNLLEKFEVQTIESPRTIEPTPPPKAPVTKPRSNLKKATPAARPATKKPEKTPEPPKVVRPEFPEDYPEELKSLNQRAKKVWDLYRPNHSVDEKIYLDINYLGMTVGKIMFTNKGKKLINSQEVWHLHARFKSAPFYSNIYELDDNVDTYVTTDRFLSIRYSLVQRESKQDVDDLQLHDREQLKTFWFYKQKKSDGDVRHKQDEKFIPYHSIDPFSVVFFYQGLPLNNGDVYEIPIINKAKILILKSVVEGRETVSTGKGSRKAIRVHATTQYSGDHLKSGDLYFWFSDDEKRTLVKARAKIKIGSVTAELVE